jgi:hypothetical protein
MEQTPKVTANFADPMISRISLTIRCRSMAAIPGDVMK